MKKVYVNRLLKLAEFLKTVPRKQFDIGVWREESARCGAVCCAAGWACTIPSFKRAGLKLVENSFYAYPSYRDETEFGALRAFFGIDSESADEMFSLLGYEHLTHRPTPKDVAKKIEAFVKIATSPAAKVYKELTGSEITSAV